MTHSFHIATLLDLRPCGRGTAVLASANRAHPRDRKELLPFIG